MVGKDWTHSGIAKFYSDIMKNGYKIMYLTSRAIGQSKTTKEFLENVVQNSNSLPRGPVIMSPDRLFKSFVREVIHRTPQKFKAEKLREIAGLFPEERNPFFAGFGNRDTDAIAYRAAGVPLNKIFIINTESTIYVYNNTYAKTYSQLDDLVFEMFPPVNQDEELADYEFGDLNFWKPDYLPLLDDDI
jgi:phosphatidate phosphatase LPIN